VTVRVNDRGPFVPGRIVDASYSAAETLGKAVVLTLFRRRVARSCPAGDFVLASSHAQF
jgi:hypothetical protein